MKYKLIILIIIFFQSIELFPQWQEVNHGINGGYVTSIINVKGNLLISTLNDGVYFSDDNGENWTQRNKGLIELPRINKLINKGDTIIALDNSGNICISYNLGNNWEIKLTGLIGSGKSIGTLYKNNLILINGDSLFISNDLGKTWKDKSFSELGKIELIETINDNILLSNGLQLFVSSDTCNSFTKINNFYSTLLKKIGDILYINNGKDLYYSTNFGITWLQSNTVDMEYPIFIEKIGEFLYVAALNGTYISSDSGKTFIKMNDIKPNYSSLLTTLVVDGNIFIGTDVGIFKSSDSLKSWQDKNKGLHNITVRNICFEKDLGNIWDNTTVSGNLFETEDYGNNWIDLRKKWSNLRIDTLKSISIITNGEYRFICSYNNLLISSDKGVNWKTADLGFKFNGMYGLKLSDSLLVFSFSKQGIYSTSDNGQTWIEKNSGFYDKTKVGKIKKIGSLLYTIGSIDPQSNYRVYSSKDNGNTWKIDSNLMTLINGYDIVSTDNNLLISYFFPDKFFVSTDFGQSWLLNKISSNYPTFVTSKGNTIFACIQNKTLSDGVSMSNDFGVTWTPINIGLTTKSVYTLQIDNNYIYAGTAHGMFKAKLSDFGLSDINEPTIENQNYLYAFPAYPVPSNTGFVKSLIYWDTSIDIDNAKTTITNITGEIINTDHKLSIEKNNNFNGNLIWDCRNMPSGAYFIKIEHGSASVTLKVMVD